MVIVLRRRDREARRLVRSTRDHRSRELRVRKLTALDLRSYCFACADLWGADLTECDLTGADLSGANLASAFLTGAHTAKLPSTD